MIQAPPIRYARTIGINEIPDEMKWFIEGNNFISYQWYPIPVWVNKILDLSQENYYPIDWEDLIPEDLKNEFWPMCSRSNNAYLLYQMWQTRQLIKERIWMCFKNISYTACRLPQGAKRQWFDMKMGQSPSGMRWQFSF